MSSSASLPMLQQDKATRYRLRLADLVLTRHSPADNRTFLLLAIAFSGAVAVFISYSTAWCVRTCGSTTYSMVGALNK